MTDYTELNRQLAALTENVPHRIANLSNAAALLYHTLEDLNWAGFYLMENGMLVLGPFQGRPACIEIPVGRGVCGTAVAQDKTQRVPDVHQFPGHIACDGASRSDRHSHPRRRADCRRAGSGQSGTGPLLPCRSGGAGGICPGFGTQCLWECAGSADGILQSRDFHS